MAEHIAIAGQKHIVMQCPECGVWYAFPAIIYETAYNHGGYWSCPNGHRRGWERGADHTEIANLRRERDRLKQNAAQLEDEIRVQQQLAQTAEKKYQQARRRAVAGICPCCNRTFVNVQRHMLSKHSNVVPIAQKERGNV